MTTPTPIPSKTKNSTLRNILGIFAKLLLSALVLLSFLAFFSARWYISTYGQLGFDSILYTLLSDLNGLEPELITSFILKSLIPTLVCSTLISLLCYYPSKKKLMLVMFKRIKLRLFPIKRGRAFILCLPLAALLIAKAAIDVELVSYLQYYFSMSTLYQDEYIDPAATTITFPEQKRNLIYIFMESMETSFFSTEQGGFQDENVIPELYDLAQTHVNFSHNDGVGGFNAVNGTTWTIGGMVAQTAGIPLKTPPGIGGNDYGTDGSFLPGITSITDVLHNNGYYQALMVGSHATFGGRQQYFQQHNIDHIYDINTMWEDGIVESGRYVWWGAEDCYLYAYAQQELTKIAAQNQPFAFTMLTVDTHHIGGYFCELCKNIHDEKYENVYACASRQIADFIRWIQVQDFYENTTIVIVGDHRSMDGEYFKRNAPDGYIRRVYNCIINPAASPINSKNRVFCALDMFPTTLAAMGCQIDSDRLGLGTNLFSDTPTLAEQMGLNELNIELGQNSAYYTNHFFFGQ